MCVLIIFFVDRGPMKGVGLQKLKLHPSPETINHSLNCLYIMQMLNKLYLKTYNHNSWTSSRA